MERILAFDIETPNYNNDRICSIGLAVIEDGEVIESQYYLINPECEFDYRNTQIHGIGPKDVINAPIFPEVWSEICELFRSNLVVAHNANFDLCVLRKTLLSYDINESLVYFIDTLAMARSMVKETDNHKLPTLCEYFDIPLKHHNAGSDSQACANLLCCLLNAGANLDRYTKSFNLEKDNLSSSERKPQRLSTNSQSLLTLNGILSGITCDDVLVEAEIDYLQKWLKDNTTLKGNYPYDKIYSIISTALADGILEKTELDYMLQLFKQITDPVKEIACDYDRLDIKDKSICLTGEFDYGSKADVNALLILHGAYIHKSVTQKTDILLVGGQGSEAWSAGNYGNKVKKALEIQAKGINILLIREADFFAALED